MGQGRQHPVRLFVQRRANLFNPRAGGHFAPAFFLCHAWTAGLSYQRIEPGYRIPFAHKHKNQEEVYVLVSGSARIKLEDEVRNLKQWDAVRVHRDTVRGFEAGDEGAEFIVVGAPNTGPGDAEMIQGWWND